MSGVMGSGDEMVDGSGRLRTPYVPIMEAARGLGLEELARRAALLNRQVRLAAPFGANTAREYDPLPAPLTATDFAAIEAGVVQRARLLNLVLEDLYGPQETLRNGAIPPMMVFRNPNFIRSLHTEAPFKFPRLSLYAADLIRGADGRFQVLRDHTGIIPGLGHALTLRRLAASTVPELFRAGGLRSLRPAREMLADHLQRGAQGGLIAVLSAGLASPAEALDMMDDALLARALGVLLIEPGDVAARGGALHVKTLSGLLHVDTLICGLGAAELDPLEQGGRPSAGITGAFSALRAGVLRILNIPGSALAEDDALAPYLDPLFSRLLGEAKLLASAAGDPVLAASRAPFVAGASLLSRPLRFRIFAWHDGVTWQVLPGGIALNLETGLEARAAPHRVKDVWVLDVDEPHLIAGPAPAEPPERLAFLAAAHLPSRVADNLFWLGRSVERLEAASRLLMLALPRLESGTSLPRDVAERDLIARCLAAARLLPAELAGGAVSGRLLRGTLARRRSISGLVKEVGRLVNAASERLSPSMLSTVQFALHQAVDALGDNEEAALPSMLTFAATFAGIAAENMVRDGGWLFLEMGRRLERGETLAESLAILLDAAPERLEPGLTLAIELTDSVLSYDLRHGGIIATAPVLAMVLADTANPRSLAFQCAALRLSLERLGADDDAEAVRLLQHEGINLAGRGSDFHRPLCAVAQRLRILSNRVQRRFFTLLPEAHQLNEEETVEAGQ